MLIGVAPDADWRAKLLIYQVTEGQSWTPICDCVCRSRQVVARSSKRRDTYAPKLVRMRCCGGVRFQRSYDIADHVAAQLRGFLPSVFDTGQTNCVLVCVLAKRI